MKTEHPLFKVNSIIYKKTSQKNFKAMSQEPRLPDIYLYKGISFFIHGLDSKTDINRTKYWKIAASEYCSMHAILNLLNLRFKEVEEVIRKNAILPIEIISDMINIAKSALSFHLTPAYILLAITHYWLGRMYQNINCQDNARLHYIEMVRSLLVADELVPHSTSAINNAYLGLGITSSNAEKISNLIELGKHYLSIANYTLPSLFKCPSNEIQHAIDHELKQAKVSKEGTLNHQIMWTPKTITH